MSANSKIEWTDHTFNPWIGCTKVSPACDNCYAEVSTPSRTLGVTWGADQERRRTSPSNWAMPLRWNAQAEAFQAQHGRRQRVFCASLADVFDNKVPQLWRTALFALINDTPNLDWLLLTKRIGNAARMLREDPPEGIDMALLKNLWLGATICNQEEADRDIPKLLRVPAAKRFLSMEPLLSLVDARRYLARHCERHPGALEPDGKCEVCEGRGIWGLGDEPLTEAEKAPIRPGLDWVIVGGESGTHARPMHPDWARDLRDQCVTAGVSFLFKQWGEWLPINQQDEAFTNRLYCSNRVAKLHEDQGALDDCYGRRCTVDYTVVHFDGTTHSIHEPNAFLQGTEAMQTFKVGKKAAGRLLDAVQHDGYPA
ncbi:MAG: phage Gp37/Gp68 family protein [Hydrogenophaga sp.]|uniref:phage Gp37/Gp68 family protein n=1 Tax=Hydrogenophaga sp. TaxID=1904254 RepID=UPI002AB9A44C|nr:phage Gp37/Gp68 family protein [Hydrogenophaga sp.]MDZ4282781.1 phage Gp37/Gp68 family protein [Hydrogenophaga sp.]